MIRSMIRKSLIGTLALSMLFVVVTGCSRKAEMGTVSGNVSFQDQPINKGMIAFFGPSGKVISGNIENGAYTVEGIEVGPNARVTIMSHPPSPMMQPPTGQVEGQPVYAPGQFVRIPNRYGNHKQSGLTCDVVDGTQTHDFVLKP